MSKNIEEIVDSVMPKLDSSSFREGIIIRDADRKCLREALTEKKLVVPMSENDFTQAMLNWEVSDKKNTLSQWLYQAQFGGDK